MTGPASPPGAHSSPAEGTRVVTLFCTDRDEHDPVTTFVYVGPVPPPPGWGMAMPSSVFELLCCAAVERGKPACPDHRHDCGGCGRAPRPSDSWLRSVIEAVADTPTRSFDVSKSSL